MNESKQVNEIWSCFTLFFEAGGSLEETRDGESMTWRNDVKVLTSRLDSVSPINLRGGGPHDPPNVMVLESW